MHKENSVGSNYLSITRREFVWTAALATATLTAGAATGFCSTSTSGRPIKLGLVSPKTGSLAAFAEADDFVLSGIRNILAAGLVVNGTNHPVIILEKDSYSDPSRAYEVARDLIKSDKVDLLLTADTPETVYSVSDQAELNGIPCVSTAAPWQPYVFGRGGKVDHGFEWSYHFFWGLDDVVAVFTNLWGMLPTNKVVGALWPNDSDGKAFSDAQSGFPPRLRKLGFKLVDNGRFQSSGEDFWAQIRLFKHAKVEILTGVLPPPAFATFWSQAAQQDFHPKIATIAKALSFPASVESLGKRGLNLTTDVWWSPAHPFKSGLTGRTSAEFCAEYETRTGKQWTQPMGFKHALFEVAIDALKRTTNIDSPTSIRDAIRSTNYASIVGPVSWTANPYGNPAKNVSKTPLVAGQWVSNGKSGFNLVVVNSETAKQVPTQARLELLP